jgi:hypothetical protein
VGLFSRKRRGPRHGVHVGDPRFEGWETVAEFGDAMTASAFAGRLAELGIENAMTADEEPDENGIGDVYLSVPPERYGDATVALDGLDLD